MARCKFFVTGTDTDSGKTLITCGLLEKARQSGCRTVAGKPVAAGCTETPTGLHNDDALALMAAMTQQLPYTQVNPVALREAMAPHIAARREQRQLSVARLSGFCNGLLNQAVDLALLEGAGGWRVPLNPRETVADLVKELHLPVILVVGMRLGCLNHALLTAEAVARDGLSLAGWVANRVDADMVCFEENLMTLRTLLPAPCLGVVPFLHEPSAGQVASFLDLTPLFAESGS